MTSNALSNLRLLLVIIIIGKEKESEGAQPSTQMLFGLVTHSSLEEEFVTSPKSIPPWGRNA